MSKRALCPHCERPVKTCLCNDIVTLKCAYQLVILQDPKEAKHALSSAPILAKSIVGARLIIGDLFDPIVLLGKNWQQDSLLVFPNTESLSGPQAAKIKFKHLILLDGTWRKVSRLLHLNPWLTKIPSIAIQPTHSSEYTIRKSPRDDGLSTIEAAVSVLNDLHAEQNFSQILPAFRKMIKLQISAMGIDKFQNNYLNVHNKVNLKK
ncbi:MAG: DTW domain-containing protein YfiP [Oleispira sp.]|jgi:DTW domain-containing protein YfiP